MRSTSKKKPTGSLNKSVVVIPSPVRDIWITAESFDQLNWFYEHGHHSLRYGINDKRDRSLWRGVDENNRLFFMSLDDGGGNNIENENLGEIQIRLE